MAKLKLLVELDYDADFVHFNGEDEEAYQSFIDDVLGADPNSDEAIILHSNLWGDYVGTVKLLEIVKG